MVVNQLNISLSDFTDVVIIMNIVYINNNLQFLVVINLVGRHVYKHLIKIVETSWFLPRDNSC